MAHYAFISERYVTEVINGKDETEHFDGKYWEDYYATQRTGQECKRTSYNTYIDKDGVSKHTDGGTPFRGCYAGRNYFYDEVNNVFVPPDYTYDAKSGKYILPPYIQE